MKTIKILGLNSSPIANGNTAFLLEHALTEAKSILPNAVQTEHVALAGMAIKDCNHCNWCLKKQTINKPCAINDNAIPILKKIAVCDVLALASPVYFARLSGMMACLLDRTRCFLRGAHYQMALRGKVGVALAVAWGRNSGIEPTLASLHNAFLLHEMLTPSSYPAGAIYGVGAVSRMANASNSAGDGADKIGVSGDVLALKATALLIKKALESVTKT